MLLNVGQQSSYFRIAKIAFPFAFAFDGHFLLFVKRTRAIAGDLVQCSAKVEKFEDSS